MGAGFLKILNARGFDVWPYFGQARASGGGQPRKSILGEFNRIPVKRMFKELTINYQGVR